jgi:hypothetical protein
MCVLVLAPAFRSVRRGYLSIAIQGTALLSPIGCRKTWMWPACRLLLVHCVACSVACVVLSLWPRAKYPLSDAYPTQSGTPALFNLLQPYCVTKDQWINDRLLVLHAGLSPQLTIVTWPYPPLAILMSMRVNRLSHVRIVFLLARVSLLIGEFVGVGRCTGNALVSRSSGHAWQVVRLTMIGVHFLMAQAVAICVRVVRIMEVACWLVGCEAHSIHEIHAVHAVHTIHPVHVEVRRHEPIWHGHHPRIHHVHVHVHIGHERHSWHRHGKIHILIPHILHHL